MNSLLLLALSIALTFPAVSNMVGGMGTATDTPQIVEQKQEVQVSLASSKAETVDVPLSDALLSFIEWKCAVYEIDFYLFLGLIKTETNFNSNEIHHNTNGTIDYGLCQINTVSYDEAASALKKRGFTKEIDIMNPYHNVLLALEELTMGREYFEDGFSGEQLERAMIASFNRGRYGAKKFYWNNGTFNTEYTKKVYSARDEIMKG